MLLNRLKLILGIEGQDELLFEILELVSSKLNTYLKTETIPTSLEWILIELSVQRFNRIGSEGMSTETIEGKRIDYKDEFADYVHYLDDYINTNTQNKGYKLL